MVSIPRSPRWHAVSGGRCEAQLSSHTSRTDRFGLRADRDTPNRTAGTNSYKLAVVVCRASGDGILRHHNLLAPSIDAKGGRSIVDRDRCVAATAGGDGAGAHCLPWLRSCVTASIVRPHAGAMRGAVYGCVSGSCPKGGAARRDRRRVGGRSGRVRARGVAVRWSTRELFRDVQLRCNEVIFGTRAAPIPRRDPSRPRKQA